jgi:orotidine-5'-phosphate decarboxylase
MKKTEQGLFDRWMELVDKKGTVLCAGIDPSHLPFNETSCDEKKEWALRYIEAVAPYCAAVKPNIQFWKAGRDMETLGELYQCASSLGLLVIEDSKLADIGSTNEAALSFAAAHADAITVAPFAGNLQSTVVSAKSLGLGVITLCLMSNPEYRLMKRKLVPIPPGVMQRPGAMLPPGAPGFPSAGETYLEQYLFMAYEARMYGADGVVVGAPSPENGISVEELEAVAGQLAGDMLVLCPGFGAQGGSLREPFRVFGADKIIVNAGRAVMYPRGPASTPAEQTEAAKEIRGRLNLERASVHG